MSKKKDIKIFGLSSKEAIDHFEPLLPKDFDMSRGRYVMGAVDADLAPVGVCWFSFDGFEYEILFIGVHPDYRRQGIGSRLLQKTLESLYDMSNVMPAKWLRWLIKTGLTKKTQVRYTAFWIANAPAKIP